MLKSNTLVSVLVPVFNEEDNVEKCYQAIKRVFDTLPHYSYEIIFTDNHSTDRTFSLLNDIARQDNAVKVARFSRNCGYQKSLLTAYKLASGQCAVQIDCDLQDPPELIKPMLERWAEGHEVVYGIRRSRKEGRVITAIRRIFYWLINTLSDDELPLNTGDFRLVDRRILDELQTVDDASPYLRGLISAMGFSQVGLEYDRQARTAGESKFRVKHLFSIAVDGILNHSLVPLRLASFMALFVGVATMLMIFAFAIGKFAFGQDWPAGFATTTVLILFSITLNAVFLGIIGEYLGRIFIQIKRQAAPIIQTTLNLNISNSQPLSVEARRDSSRPPVEHA